MGIVQNLEKILQARYGRDVRQAIHDSISDLNEIANTAQTSAKAYYEGTQRLAQTISGNVGIDDSTATLGTTYSSHKIEDKTRTNLINPTLQTTTVNGVTCTNNGDGTYTLSGTSTGVTEIKLLPSVTYDETRKDRLINHYGKLRFTALPSGAGDANFYAQVAGATSEGAWTGGGGQDMGNGITFIPSKNQFFLYIVRLVIPSGRTFFNLVVKPMLTTDLSTTYDDFVSYSGEGELNANVAKLYKEIQTLKNAITELGGTV